VNTVTSSGAALIPPEIQANLESSRKDETYWLVGGAVRDYLLQRRVVDFDFVVEGDALGLARRVANQAGGDFYTLDDDRRAGRVLLSLADSNYCLDFAQITGKSLEEDLRARDFTINAMALDLDHPDTLIDPSGGLQDLRDGLLRLPASDAISADPIRALRALRLAVDLNFKIEPGAFDQVKQATDWLDQISPERLRDELFRLLGLNRPALGLRLLDHAGLLEVVLPSVASLRGQEQPPPHQFDMLDHTLAVVQRLTELLATLAPRHDAESSGVMALAEVALRLGRFRQPLSRYLLHEVSSDRTVRQLLYLAALFHDSGKPSVTSQTLPESEKAGEEHDAGLRFIGHNGCIGSF
jgi:tRNA nucleotidyltransferase/poly(A) polymerase